MTGLATDAAPIRSIADVEGFARQCFRGGGGDRVGVELEFLVFDHTAPMRQVPVARIAEALPPLPGGSGVTFEPGGQLELSGPPARLPDAIGRLLADVRLVRRALREAGLIAVGVGLDPVRPPRRQSRLPRYEAMAELLGEPYGPLMMCSTASVQINLDLGEHPAVRWERTHLLGPVLSAAFANSPLSQCRPWGWMSGRQRVWENLDRTRTAPVRGHEDPVTAWTEYLLDARLMLTRDSDGRRVPIGDGGERRGSGGDGGRPGWLGGDGDHRGGVVSDGREGSGWVRDGVTFRGWLAEGERVPTLADLAYHATTVFPPVRPRGWLEVRYLDAQHPESWPVCAAVTAALVVDDRAADAALAAAEPYGERWSRAARCGLADPWLRRAADVCFRAAAEALPRMGAESGLVRAVAEFADRHVTPGRSPAAYLLDVARGRGLPAWLTEGGSA